MRTRNYEAMFLLNNNVASADFDAAAANADSILEKHGATIVHKEKWDERKLAYEIKGQRRATYYLVYFTAPPSAIDNIHEDVHLNEVILRHLVLVLDLPIDEHIKTRAEERERLAEDSRRNSLSGWGDSRRSRRDRPRDTSKKPADGEKPAGDKPAGDRPAEADKPAEGDKSAEGSQPAGDAPEAKSVPAEPAKG